MLENIADKFQGELNPGERLVWTGQPQQGFVLRSSDALMIPFSLLWGGFTIGWEAMAIRESGFFFMAVWGIPFVLVGLYMIFGRFFVDWLLRRKTFYALTNERAIIISGLFNQDIKSLDLTKLSEINLNIRNNGRGTITFGTSYSMAWMYAGTGFPNRGRYLAPSFDIIDDARTVYQHIKRLQQEGS